MAEIAGLPFWELRYDTDGNPDPDEENGLLQAVSGGTITDLLIFAHGWNNNRQVAFRLYQRFFGVLAEQFGREAGHPPTKLALAGVFWPSQRWSDEPIPDFDAPPSAGAVSTGAAGLGPAPGVGSRDQVALSPEIDQDTLTGLHEIFPTAVGQLDRMAELLADPSTDAAQAEFYSQLKQFAVLVGADGDDGEDDRDRTELAPGEPPMLLDGPRELFTRYADALRQTGAQLAAPAGAAEIGAAGLSDSLAKAMHGAKEALRQVTYWQMKNRAGTVGREGLGPLLGRLHERAPDLRIHLIGHSFGARLVSYALAGMPAGLQPSPVKAVTLLEGAFSQWAFAPKLPSDPSRSGALAGMPARIDGPLVAVHSRFDRAVGTFYPLASMAARDDSAAVGDANSRWGGIGANGAQGAHAQQDGVRPAGAGNRYPFAAQQVLNVDASDVVRAGGPPSGAHSDIVHPELAWIVLTAGRIV
jgi:hypothetical protein